MFWLIGVSHAERWKAFLIAVALADLQTHTPASKVIQQGGRRGEVRQIMREKEEETSARPSAHPSVLEPDLGQALSPTAHTLLLLGGRNTATFGNHNNVCIQCVYICSCSHLCICECIKASFASFAHEGWGEGNVIPRHKLTNCVESSPYPIV